MVVIVPSIPLTHLCYYARLLDWHFRVVVLKVNGPLFCFYTGPKNHGWECHLLSMCHIPLEGLGILLLGIKNENKACRQIRTLRRRSALVDFATAP